MSDRLNEGVKVAEGSFGGNEKQLQCIIGSDRVDWVLRPSTVLSSRPPEGLITVGPFEGELPLFLDLSERWLQGSASITRLAFGAVLVAKAADLVEAREKLAPLLPNVTLDVEDVSDFLYRVNRRRVLGSTPRVHGNRLSTWSILQGRLVAVPGNAPHQLQRTEDFHACRLELDVNTADILSSEMNGEQAAELFKELVDIGKEIAEKGDIP